MKRSLTLNLILILAVICAAIALIPINWELRLAESVLSIEKVSNRFDKNIATYMDIMKFTSINQAIKNVLIEFRKIFSYCSLLLILFYIISKYFKLSFKQKFNLKRNSLSFLLSAHLIIFCFIFSVWIFYISYYFDHYYKKSNDEIRMEKNIHWSTDFYSFIKICQKTIPQNDKVLLLITEFSDDVGKYHIYFNYFLYPRKIYIHFPDSSASVKNQRKKWVKKYTNYKISLTNLDLINLRQQEIDWIIEYEDSFIFSKDKARIINIEEFIKKLEE
jgi:magnesium-transporting ATPase (P-type)